MQTTATWNFRRINIEVCIVATSLVPRPEEEEEEKGPGFSRSRMRLIAVEFHRLRILTPESILNVTLSVDL